MSAGYSGTQLAKKLGIKDGFSIKLINEPAYYFDLFTDMPADIKIAKGPKGDKNFIHYFVKEAAGLRKTLTVLKNEIVPDGMIWVSWPKKGSKVVTDVGEQLIRDTALSIGLVDIKVCAVDDVWSGLKLVIPVKYRVVK